MYTLQRATRPRGPITQDGNSTTFRQFVSEQFSLFDIHFAIGPLSASSPLISSPFIFCELSGDICLRLIHRGYFEFHGVLWDAFRGFFSCTTEVIQATLTENETCS